MSNFTNYFNNLKKIIKNFNVDYTKKIIYIPMAKSSFSFIESS